LFDNFPSCWQISARKRTQKKLQAMKTKSVKSFGSLVLRGSRYYAFWRVKDSTGKKKSICKALRDEHGAAITTRPEAEKAKARLMEIVAKQDEIETLRSIQHAIDDKQADVQRLQDERHPALTLAATWSAFLRSTERRDCSKASLNQYECKWGIFVEWMKREHPEAKQLRDVTPAIAESYLQSLNHGKVASGTFNFMLFVLRYVFRTLKDEARLPDNVWMKARKKTRIAFSRRQLTVDELQRVCASARGELKGLFALGLYTGMRLGDCATLKWGEVDLRRNQIRRIPNKVARRNPVPIVIPIHPALRVMLAELPANERGVYVLPKTASVYLGPSKPLVSKSIQQHFKANGIETLAKREVGSYPVVEVGFHSLRHTFVSLCRASNVPLSVVESLVGHSNPAMTQHYTHTSELAASNAIALLPSVTGDAVAKPAVRSRDELLRELIEGMTPKNFREKKSAALAMLAGENHLETCGQKS
jgi:integrase